MKWSLKPTQLFKGAFSGQDKKDGGLKPGDLVTVDSVRKEDGKVVAVRLTKKPKSWMFNPTSVLLAVSLSPVIYAGTLYWVEWSMRAVIGAMVTISRLFGA